MWHGKDALGGSGLMATAALALACGRTSTNDATRLALGFDAALLWKVAPDFGASQRIAALSVWPTFDVDFSTSSEFLVSGGGWSMFSAEGTHGIQRPVPPSDSAADCLLTLPRVSPRKRWLAVGELTPHPTSALAVFTPNGDIIAARNDGSLTRYCRVGD